MPTSINSSGVTFPDSSTQTTAFTSSSVVASLNGATGALKGATLVGSYSMESVTSLNITGLSNAGYYYFSISLNFGTAASFTGIGFRTSTDNGATFATAATSYTNIDYIDQNATNSTVIEGVYVGSSTTAATLSWSGYFYTGSANKVANISGLGGLNYNSAGLGGANTIKHGGRTAVGQANAIQIVRVSGTKTITAGVVNVYYLGQ